jgi:hypothetical protein
MADLNALNCLHCREEVGVSFVALGILELRIAHATDFDQSPSRAI